MTTTHQELTQVPQSGFKQRLAAILAADMAGYSRLMAQDEGATVAALDRARAVFRSQIESRQGRVIDMASDPGQEFGLRACSKAVSAKRASACASRRN